jgi:hypothetical protein
MRIIQNTLNQLDKKLYTLESAGATFQWIRVQKSISKSILKINKARSISK